MVDDLVGVGAGADLPRLPVACTGGVYCHSGAFVMGNLDTDHRQCVEFARRGRCTVISVDYRLAPENPYPAALDDATAVLDGGRRTCGTHSASTRLGLRWRAAAQVRRWPQAWHSGPPTDGAGGRVPAAAPTGARRPTDDDPRTSSSTLPASTARRSQLMWRHYLAGAPATSAAVPARSIELACVDKRIHQLLGTRPAARRSARLCAAAVGRRRHDRTARLRRHVPRIRLTATGVGTSASSCSSFRARRYGAP